jgi:hypothetical protein
MHGRRLGRSSVQYAVGTRDGVALGTTVAFAAGQPRAAGTMRRITVVIHFWHSTVSKSWPMGGGGERVPPPPPPLLPPPLPFHGFASAPSRSNASTVARMRRALLLLVCKCRFLSRTRWDGPRLCARCVCGLCACVSVSRLCLWLSVCASVEGVVGRPVSTLIRP